MICKKCGAHNESNSKFCNVCGASINKEEQNEITPEIIDNKSNSVVEIEVPNAKKIAIWSIVVYCGIFYVLSQLLAPAVMYLYCLIKGWDLTEISDISTFINTVHPEAYNSILAITNLAIYIPILVILCIISINIFKYDLKKIQGRVGRFFGTFGIGIALIFGVSLISSIIINILITLYATLLETFPSLKESLGAITSSTSQNQEAINDMIGSGTLPLISMIFVTIICAPIVEELIFRKSFFALSKKKGIACIIISGLIFGSIHVGESILLQLLGIIENTPGYNFTNIIIELFNLVSYVGSGVVFGIIYRKSNYNIFVTMLIHATYNAIGFVAIFLG